MKPTDLVTKMLGEAADGAHLTCAELAMVYANDYVGDPGFLRCEYVGLSDTDASHRYIVIIPLMVIEVYVSKGKDGKLTMDFGGNPLGEFHDQAEAETFFEKETHMQGGGRERKLKTFTSRRRVRRPIDPTIDPSNAHWDGNFYAL